MRCIKCREYESLLLVLNDLLNKHKPKPKRPRRQKRRDYKTEAWIVKVKNDVKNLLAAEK